MWRAAESYEISEKLRKMLKVAGSCGKWKNCGTTTTATKLGPWGQLLNFYLEIVYSKLIRLEPPHLSFFKTPKYCVTVFIVKPRNFSHHEQTNSHDHSTLFHKSYETLL